jgi:hypothetical protein
MLAAVGRGIQAFASVEHGLSLVFASIMEPANRNASFFALDAARHIETKMRIVKAAASVQLNPAQLERFNNLLNRCKTRAELRHKLAHWTVSYWPGARTAAEAREMKPALCPPPASPDAHATLWGKERPIHIKEIDSFRDNCNKLTLELFEFSIALDTTRAPDDPHRNPAAFGMRTRPRSTTGEPMTLGKHALAVPPPGDPER